MHILPWICPRILAIGLGGYIKEIHDFHLQVDRSDQEGVRKDHFYTALTISIRSFQHFIRRYQHLAWSLAEKETNGLRKKELELISRNCDHISEYPPDNFYQALQLVYFVQLVLQIESNGHSVSLGRLDQYLFPFYRNDKLKGLLDGRIRNRIA